MRFLIAILITFLALPVSAADMPTPKAPTIAMPVAPTVTVPAPAVTTTPNKAGKLTPAQQLRVTMRVPLVKKQIVDLTPDEQRVVLRKSAPPRQKLTDADRAARSKATRDSWAAKTPEMKKELRQKQLAAWQKLSPEDRAYRRERMQEQLQALPETDRKAIIAPFVPSNTAH